MFDWMEYRREHQDPLDFVLDTNAVRRLAVLSDLEWRRMRTNVARLRLRSGWIPWVLAELTITNLDRKGPLDPDELSRIQTAADRHDDLLGDNILLDPEPRLVRDVHLLAGASPPRADQAPNDARRKGLNFFKQLSSPAQLLLKRSPDALVATYCDGQGRPRFTHTAPLTFEGYAKRNTVGLATPPTNARAPAIKDAAIARAARLFNSVASRLGVPAEVAKKAVDAHGPGVVVLGAALYGILEGVYLAQLSAGIRSEDRQQSGTGPGHRVVPPGGLRARDQRRRSS